MEAAAHSSLLVSSDSIDLLLFGFLIFCSLVISPPDGPEHATGRAPVEATFNPSQHTTHSSSHSRGREVKNKRV